MEVNGIGSFADVWNGLDWSILLDMALRIIPALICITFHELSHGLAAYRLGDNTAKEQGRLTLNPIRHIDIFGLLMMVVFRLGWAKPVPVDMRSFKNPKRGMAITALAGPASNMVLSVVLLFIYGVGSALAGESGILATVLDLVETTAYLSLSLGIFNLLPVPPLDGSKILFALLPDRYYYMLMRYERYGMILLLALVWSGILGTPLSKLINGVYDVFFEIARLGYRLAA